MFGQNLVHVNIGKSERTIFYWATTSSILGTYSAFGIQDLLRSLCQYPFIKLNISGHADTLGPVSDTGFIDSH